MKPLRPFEIPLNGINLIEASAGTGKTYNIASLYVRALIEQDIEVDDILVVTYTEAATKELRERLMQRLGESVQSLEGEVFDENEFLQKLPSQVIHPEKAVAKLRSAIRSFDQASIYTIHGFCYQALQEQAFDSRALFDAELIGDDTEVVREVMDDLWRNWVREATQNELKRPLLKYLMDKGLNPDTLTAELSEFVSKPYLHIQPESMPERDLESELKELSRLFKELKEEWLESKEEIHSILGSGHLSYYTSKNLSKWMSEMQEMMSEEIPPIELFKMYRKFRQSAIDDSLKKSSIKKGVSPPQHPFFKLAEAYESIATSLQDFDIRFKLDLFHRLRDALEGRKEELQVLSYDDLLIQLRNALADPERGRPLSQKLRKAYPIALVDEFQDTDPVQYEIFSNIYREGSENSALFMIGDPKQSIYSFRGADIFAYLKAKKDASDEKTFSLSRNFRSVPELLEAVNQFFGMHEDPFLLKDIPFQPVEAGREEEAYKKLSIDGQQEVPVELRDLNGNEEDLPAKKSDAQEKCARDTAFEIAKLLRLSMEGKAKIGEEAVEASDIAVLVRSHYQAALIREALKMQGINSVQYSQDSVFDSGEAEELQHILRAIAEPANEGYVTSALATQVMGYDAKALLRLEEDEIQWVEKLEQFATWHDHWQTSGFAYMFRHFLKDEKIAEKLIGRSQGERKLTNLVHLAELLQLKEKDGKTGSRSLLQWLARKRQEERTQQEEEQLRLESDENLVQVVTMHRSKGLEYPIVYCPFLWHGTKYADHGKPVVYHDAEHPSKVYLDFHGKQDPNRDPKRFKMAQEELAESVRLAYVAITRAKQKCVIPWIQAKKSEYSPLGYLLLGPERSLQALEKTISSNSRYSSLEPGLFASSLNTLIKKHPGLFKLESKKDIDWQKVSLPQNEDSGLQNRSFQRKEELTAGWGLTSFSAITKNQEADYEIEYDLYGEEVSLEEEMLITEDEGSIFNFPKGPNPGTAIHHIFEEIEFGNPRDLDEIISEKLGRQDIGDRWVGTVREMVIRTLNKELPAVDQTLRLADIHTRDMIAEMEFYFSCGVARLQQLLEIIRPGEPVPDFASNYSEAGFMKGFIDLSFKYNERYYILDYKTNHLGNSFADYAADHMQTEIKEALYDLQYHLYVLALHRYLANVDPTYSYEDNFGGVYYLFLRGINEDGEEGIFYDRPDIARIEKLNRYLERRGAYG